MTKGKVLAIVGLGGLAAYLLLIRRNPQTGATGLDELAGAAGGLFSPSAAGAQTLIPAKGAGNTAEYGLVPPAAPGKPSVIGIVGATSAAVASWLAAGGSTAAAGAAGATAATGGASAGSTTGAASAGLGTAATIGITAGIAGAALLAWAVWKKGLFRGGAEALYVNPARDQFLAQFARWDYMRDSRNPPGFYGLALILVHTDPTVQPGQGAGSGALFQALNKADTMPRFNAAVDAIVANIKTATPEQDQAITRELVYYGKLAA